MKELVNNSWIFLKLHIYKIILFHWKLLGLGDFSHSYRKWHEYGLFTNFPSWSNINDTFPEVINSRRICKNVRENIFLKVNEKRHGHTNSTLTIRYYMTYYTYWSNGGTQEILRINNSVILILLICHPSISLHVSACMWHHQGACMRLLSYVSDRV
jgi:hypothetical protein